MQSPNKISVFGKQRFVTPFIGIIEREYGPDERGVGLKCPSQEKLVFVAIESDDPLHYLRAFKMLAEISEVTDSIVHDCITATKSGNRLENLARTHVFNERGIYQRSMFEEAQKKALAFKPNARDVQQVIDGFAKYLVPLATKEPLGLSDVEPEPPCSTVQIVHSKAPATERPCYKPLLVGYAAESSARHAMPSAA